ncbi:MAG: hypothetical protein RL199_856 [Pseudomonadota bacterium]|jgi:hypothetical protein
MGRTHEIPREQWTSFFGAVARTEYDRRVRIELDEEGLGSQPLAEHLPLVGLALEKRGANDIEVCVKAGPRGDFEHRIPEARRLVALEGDDGDLRCLDIESAEDGHAVHTRVFFE